MDRLRGALGFVLILATAWLCCPPSLRRRVRPRTVIGGVLVLLLATLLVLKSPAAALFEGADAAIKGLLGFVDEGSRFVFGDLARADGPAGAVFAFRVLPTVVFFAALVSVLYHLRILPFVVRWMGRGLSRALGVSGAEAFSTAADVFVGQNEAPLAIRPYISSLTRSELNACMTAGFATTAGGVLAMYVQMLDGLVPGIAGHLLACSVLCAPASLVVAKLMLPETGEPVTGARVAPASPPGAANLVDAVVSGTLEGLRIAAYIGAMLIAFTALVAMIDAGLGRLGEAFGGEPGALSLGVIFGKLFWPLAWATGVPSEDVEKTAALLGVKTSLNEFFAYTQLSEALKADPAFLTPRGRLIVAYALCGFANFASIGIQIGGYAALAPERRAELSRLAPRAMFGGLLATLAVAALAGVVVA